MTIQVTQKNINPCLLHDVLAPEAGQALVPDGGEELLHAGVRHEALLLVLDGKLEPLQGLDVADLPRVTVGVVVQDHLKLVRGSTNIVQTSLNIVNGIV